MFVAEWLAKVQDIANFVSGTDGPITFFLGAGASISSNAPSTEEVERQLLALNSGRFQDLATLRSKIHQINDVEKLSALLPLFKGVIPYMGYLCLASIARHKKVLVLNLNWDNCIEEACREIGVECRSYRRHEMEIASRDAEDPKPGVVCIHLHGILDESVQFGMLETLSFSADERKLLADKFLSGTTILIGLSLPGDSDIHGLLMELQDQTDPEARGYPIWPFLRPSSRVGEQIPYAELLEARRSSRNTTIDEAVDFDVLLMNLQSALVGISFEDTASNFPGLSLPPAEQLVQTKPSLLRNHLDKRIVVLVGDPRLGKTTTAHLLAFLWRLNGQGHMQIDRVEGSTACLRAISNLGPNDSDLIKILDSPFGVGKDYESQPKLLDQLVRIAELDKGPRVIVTSRLSNWHRALKESESIDAQQIETIPSSPNEWYEQEDLRLLLQKIAPNAPPSVRSMVSKGDVRTPAGVRELAMGRYATTDIVKERAAYLCQSLDEALLTALVRLEELCDEVLTWADITGCLYADDGSPPANLRMIRTYRWEDSTWAMLDHPTDFEAVDCYLRAMPETHVRRLEELRERHLWIAKAWSRWTVVAAVRDGDYKKLAEAETSVLTELGPTLLRAASRSSTAAVRVIEHLPVDRFDRWSLPYLAYEVVQSWPQLRSTTVGRGLLKSILEDTSRMGLFATLEACLYLHKSAEQEIWDRVASSLWDLLLDETRGLERELVFDALLWKAAPDVRFDPLEFLRYLTGDLPSESPHWGAFAFSALYHPDGASRLCPQLGLDPTDLFLNPSDEQLENFTRMIRLHFIHQSRARSFLHKREWGTELKYMRRRLKQGTVPSDHRDKFRRAILQVARSPEHAGWAFHMSMNVQAIIGEYDIGPVQREVLERCQPGDQGVITALMTYEPSMELIEPLQVYLRHPASKDAMLNYMSGGLIIEDVRLDLPRFRFVRNPFDLHRLWQIRWRGLESSDIDPSDVVSLRSRLRSVQEEATNDWDCKPEMVSEVLRRSFRGDLRLIDAEGRESARATQIDPYLKVLVSAAKLLELS